MKNYKDFLRVFLAGIIATLLILLIIFIGGLYIKVNIKTLILMGLITIPTNIIFCTIYTLGSLITNLKEEPEEHYNDKCGFCKSIRDRSKNVVLLERTKSSEDNLFDIVFNEKNKIYDGDQVSEFILTGYKSEDDFKLLVEYVNELELGSKKLIIHKVSYGFQLNYCPICGDKISKKIKKFEDNYSIEIESEGE